MIRNDELDMILSGISEGLPEDYDVEISRSDLNSSIYEYLGLCKFSGNRRRIDVSYVNIIRKYPYMAKEDVEIMLKNEIRNMLLLREIIESGR